jgi:acyl carrier protein
MRLCRAGRMAGRIAAEGDQAKEMAAMTHPVETAELRIIREQVRDFITQNFLFAGGPRLEDDVSLLEHDIVDDTGMLELVLFVEETYGLSVPEEDLLPDNFDTVNRVAAYVVRKLDEE